MPGAPLRPPQARQKCPGCGTEALEDRWAATEAIVPNLAQFKRRLIVDAINHQRVAWWIKRAEDFEAAKPRKADFNGEANVEELRARWRWCHQTAAACRAKAELLRMYVDDFDDELATLLDLEGAA